MNVWEIAAGVLAIGGAVLGALGWYRAHVEHTLSRDRDFAHLIRNLEASGRALAEWRTEDEAKHAEVMRGLAGIEARLSGFMPGQESSRRSPNH